MPGTGEEPQGEETNQPKDRKQELVQKRGQQKGVITRFSKILQRSQTEEDRTKVLEYLDKMKSAMEKFENICIAYVELLEEEGTDTEESDNYLFEVEDQYMERVKAAKTWLKQVTVTDQETVKVSDNASVEPKVKASHVEPTDQTLLLSYVNLPKVELEVYSGDPLRYHSFFAIFDEHVGQSQISDAVKLSRLLQYTSGKAKESIRCCSIVGGAEGYAKAREILEQRFGNPHVISEAIMSTLRSGKPVKTPSELQQLADDLGNYYAILSSLGKLPEIDTQHSIIGIVKRLQTYIQNRWRKEAMKIKHSDDVYPTFQQFVQFVVEESLQANDPVYGEGISCSSSVSRSPASVSSTRSSQYASSFSTDVSSHNVRPCKACGESHKLFYCPVFKSMRPVDRLQFVKVNLLCENCLMDNHVVADCRRPTVCTVPGCGQRHTKFIHVSQGLSDQTQSTVNRDTIVHQADNASSCDKHTAIGVPVVPVRVEGHVHTCALLDTASTNTFCTRELVEAAHLKGTCTSLSLNTLCSKGSESKNTLVVDLYLNSEYHPKPVHLTNVYVIDHIPATVPDVDVSKYPHLRGVTVNVARSKVDILIGQDNHELLIPHETKTGNPTQPYAVRSLLGWSFCGPLCRPKSTQSDSVISNVVSLNQTLSVDPVVGVVDRNVCSVDQCCITVQCDAPESINHLYSQVESELHSASQIVMSSTKFVRCMDPPKIPCISASMMPSQHAYWPHSVNVMSAVQNSHVT